MINTMGEAAEGEDPMVTTARKGYQDLVAKVKDTIYVTNAPYGETTGHWSAPGQRVLGYVVHAPKISIATDPTERIGR